MNWYNVPGSTLQCSMAVNTKRKIDIFTLPFGEKIINILRYLNMEMDSPYSGDGIAHSEIMHCHFFDIPPIEIAKASVAVTKKNYYATANYNGPKTSLRRYISQVKTPVQPGLFDQNTTQGMKFLMSDIDYLLKIFGKQYLLRQLFQQVPVAKMGVLKYVMEQPNKGWYMQVLTNFFDFLKDESRKNPEIKLADLISIIKLMKENKIRLELNQVIFSENGVNFLTAHGSKGAGV